MLVGRTAEPNNAAPSGLASAPVVAPVAAPVTVAGREAAAIPVRHFGFRELLSDLNPLQYIPLVGTLFRAVTGDVIPAPVRDAGSLVVSTLIGGPIGAAINLGELAVEKMTGIDPEKIGDRLLADIGIGGKPGPQPAAGAIHDAVNSAPARTAECAAAWSAAQLAAYGVTTEAGNLKLGPLGGSDVLNSLELDKIGARHAVEQYAAASPRGA